MPDRLEPRDPRDPFDALRLPDDPLAPPAAFAATLRARIERALGRTPGTTTTSTTTTATTTSNGAPMPNTVSPYLSCKGALAALEFYIDVFGAVEVGERYIDQSDGRLGHAAFEIGGSHLSIADEYPDFGAVSPTTLGGSPVSFSVIVDDVDRVYERAVAAGARGLRPPEDQAYGMRAASLLDPWGHRWTVQVPLHVPPAPIEGFDLVEVAPRSATTAAPVDATRSSRSAELLAGPAQLGYFAINTPDVPRAAAFYGALLRWDVTPDGHIANIDPPGGLIDDGRWAAGAEQVVLYFQVPDLDAACQRVVGLGGSVQERADYASGGNAVCLDDQGRRFELFQPNPGYERQ